MKTKIQAKEEWKQENGLYKCPNCFKEFSKKGIGNHIWRKHTEEGIAFTESNKIKFNHKHRAPWNKGLTKETSEILAITGKKASNTKKANDMLKGRTYKHTKETKEHLSQVRKKYLKDNKNKHNWSLYHKKESEPEKVFRKILEQSNIEVVQYYIPEGDRFFEIDFAIIDKNIGFEINGNQHYKNRETYSLTDYYQERHDYFESIGWKIIEIPFFCVFKKKEMMQIISEAVNGNIVFSEEISQKIIDYRVKRREQKEALKKNLKEEKLVKQIEDLKMSKIDFLCPDLDKAKAILNMKTMYSVRRFFRKNFPLAKLKGSTYFLKNR